MKATFLYIITHLLFLNFNAFSQETFEMQEGDTSFIMQQYFMCFLYRGDISPYDSAQLSEIQNAHLAHLNNLAEDDKISLAGPFGDDQELRGIVIYHVATIDEAEMLANNDPAVKAGALIMRMRPWWAAKGSILK